MAYHMYGERHPAPPVRPRRRARRVVGVVLFALLVGFLAVAWLRPVVTSWYWEVTAPPSCGSASVWDSGLDVGGETSKAELCFVRAVRTCTPRSLLYVTSGVDTSETNDLRVVRSSGSCHIVDMATGRVDVMAPRTVELVCSGTRWDGSGWVLSCSPSSTVKLWWPRANQPGPDPADA